MTVANSILASILASYELKMIHAIKLYTLVVLELLKWGSSKAASIAMMTVKRRALYKDEQTICRLSFEILNCNEELIFSLFMQQLSINYVLIFQLEAGTAAW